MDWEEYLANLESADEQNYKRLFGEEYIKKSDVEKLIIAYKSHEINHINILQRAISALPTINLSVIDEMIEEVRNNPEFKWKNWLDARWATAICYLKMVWEQMKSTPIP